MTEFKFADRYTTKRPGNFQNQRDQSIQRFPEKTVVQLETLPDKYGKVCVRQPYPNDDYWGFFLYKELDPVE